jgi:pimeloyl-ACP methyl ester carboxylesterase
MTPLAPIITVVAALTLKSDTAPVKVKVNRPRGTVYWGGAGLDGPYLAPQIAAFASAGIAHCYAGKTNTATRTIGAPGMFIDAMRAGVAIRYQDSGEWTLAGMDLPADQFNLVGYSYGSLLAAQTANSYARSGHIVNHLVLIGSPIDSNFLAVLKGNALIKKVIVIDLKQYGDPIYAGIPQLELAQAATTLGEQMLRNKGEGHFYYAHVIADSARRWKELAGRLYAEGLR